MRFPTPITALVLMAASTIFAAPTAPTSDVNISALNFPASTLATLTGAADSLTCPSTDNSCGVVTFTSGTFTSFGQGICMQLGGNVQSIYVSKCYCSLWNSCTGSSSKDIYVAGMMMCEKPRTVNQFDKQVKFISCGGL